LVVVLVGGRRWILAVVVLGTVGMLVAADRPAAPELVVLDIGQGDAILLRDGATALLVDGGGWQNGDIAQSVLVPALAHLGVRHLAGVALTHPDVDHCAGLVGLASYLPIDRLLLSPGWADSRCVDRLLVLPGVRVKPLWRGESFNLGRWRIRTLHPAAGQRRGRNNRSLVLLATLASHRVLLTGDLERQGESQILDVRGAGELPAVDLLKVGHHGSATSTSRPWLDRLQPRLALISCGLENRYGHPADEVVERLGHHRARVLRTDRDGAIRIAFVAPGHWRITLLGPG
jgi:competence protein ComEC